MEEVDSSKENLFQAPLNSKKTLTKSSKSLSEILPYNEHLVAIESEDAVSCQICDSSGSSDGKSVGRFNYHFSRGTDFSERSAPREFLNLKGNIAKHMGSNAHIKNSKEYELAVKKNIVQNSKL